MEWTAAGLGAAALATCGVVRGEWISQAEALEALDWEKLRKRLGGALVLPDDAAYSKVRLPYNPIFDTRLPAAIAQCRRPDDVQACIEFARPRGVHVAARSGGHSYGGYSTPDRGLLVDLGPMKAVTVRANGTAVVGAGARLGDVYSALAASRRCLPSGTGPSVGISGITLGGGIGPLVRFHGLTCDHLLAAEVVLADGSRKTVSQKDDEDLFWALRGGGGGNFGIVTSFTFTAPPAPAEMTVFRLMFPPGTVGAVLHTWQDWMLEPPPPNELYSNCRLYAGNPPKVRVSGSYVGAPSKLQGFLQNLQVRVKAAGGRAPIDSESFVRSTTYLEALGSSGVEPSREASVASSRVLKTPMTDTNAVATLLAQHVGLTVMFDSLGGAVRQVGRDATAFAHRDAIATVQIHKDTTLRNWKKDRQEVSQVRDRLATLCGGGAYINYIDPTMADWASASYGDHLERLRKVARTVDPDRFFAFAQGIGG